jgi:hypothetical protein
MEKGGEMTYGLHDGPAFDEVSRHWVSDVCLLDNPDRAEKNINDACVEVRTEAIRYHQFALECLCLGL